MLYSLCICSCWCLYEIYRKRKSVVLTTYLFMLVSIWDTIYRKWKSVVFTMNLFLLVSIWDTINRKWKSVVLTMYLFIAGVYIRYSIQKMKECCTHNVSVHCWCLYKIQYTENEWALYSQCISVHAGIFLRYCIQKMNERCNHYVSVHGDVCMRYKENKRMLYSQ